jgi:hypothetical protein
MDCEGDDDGSGEERNQSRSESFAEDDDEDKDILIEEAFGKETVNILPPVLR